jgi:hypothetical protein
MSRIVIGLVVFLVGSGPAIADRTNNFVKFFYANCVQVIDDFSALEAYSKIMKWKEIPKEVAAMGGGKVDNAWGVNADGQFFIISIGSSVLEDGRHMNSCSVLSKPQNANDVAEILKSRFRLKLRIDEIEGYQRYQQFDAQVSGLPMMFNIISVDDPNVKLVNLNASYFYK